MNGKIDRLHIASTKSPNLQGEAPCTQCLRVFPRTILMHLAGHNKFGPFKVRVCVGCVRKRSLRVCTGRS